MRAFTSNRYAGWALETKYCKTGE